MTTIIAGNAVSLTEIVQLDGVPLSVSGTVTATVYSKDGRQTLIPEKAVLSTDTGANWAQGVVAVTFTNIETANLQPGTVLLALVGDSFGIRRYRLVVETLFAPTRTSLFIKDIVVDEMRGDRLLTAAAGALGKVKVSDDYIWEKVRAAESEIAHTLRVPLVPTMFFPLPPTQEQIDELDGMAYAVDPAYDYTPDMFHFEKWGYFITRQRPIIDIVRMRFAYPSQDTGFFDVPADWIRVDARYGHVRLVPSSPAIFATMNAFIMTALAGSRSIPFMIQLTYSAGLVDAETTYPELLDAIKKKAVLKIISDAFLPQSGSISADGLSESVSVDMDKYHSAIDHIINGSDGANGGLMTKIHGVRMLVM
jgi:hypothetical protein